jgi:hypothetical protein
MKYVPAGTFENQYVPVASLTTRPAHSEAQRRCGPDCQQSPQRRDRNSPARSLVVPNALGGTMPRPAPPFQPPRRGEMFAGIRETGSRSY